MEASATAWKGSLALLIRVAGGDGGGGWPAKGHLPDHGRSTEGIESDWTENGEFSQKVCKKPFGGRCCRGRHGDHWLCGGGARTRTQTTTTIESFPVNVKRRCFLSWKFKISSVFHSKNEDETKGGIEESCLLFLRLPISRSAAPRGVTSVGSIMERLQ